MVVRRAAVVAGLALTAAVPLATGAPPASAQQFYTGTTTTLPSPPREPGVPPARVVRISRLAFTGADIAQLAGLGIVAIGVGGVLVRRGRERQEPVPLPGGDGTE